MLDEEKDRSKRIFKEAIKNRNIAGELKLCLICALDRIIKAEIHKVRMINGEDK